MRESLDRLTRHSDLHIRETVVPDQEERENLVDKHLAYRQEFKEFVHNHLRSIKEATKAMDEIIKMYPTNGQTHIASKAVDVEYLEPIDWEGDYPPQTLMHHINPSFCVRADNSSFFVKKIIAQQKLEGQGGFREILSSEEARNRLKGLPWVEVVEYQAGYSNKDYSYFVSKFIYPHLSSLDETIGHLQYEINKESENVVYLESELRKLETKIKILHDFFPDYFDFHDLHMFYDSENDKIILLDLNVEPQHVD